MSLRKKSIDRYIIPIGIYTLLNHKILRNYEYII